MEIKTLEQGLKALNEFQTTHNEAIQKSEDKLGEHEQKLEKMSADIVKAIDLANELKAIQNAPAETKETGFDQKNFEKKFNEFARKGQPDESFESFCHRTYSEAEIKTLSTDSDPDGGVFVTPQRLAPERTRYFETSPIRGLARTITTSKNSVELPILNGARVGASKVGERGTRSETNTREYDKKIFQTHNIYSMPGVTKDMLSDGDFNIIPWINDDIQEDFEIFENTSFVTGSGVGEARGFMTYSAWTTNGTYESGKIEQINSGNATNFTADGVIDLQNSMQERYQPRAVFGTKRTNFKNIAKLKDANGNYLFNTNLDKNVGLPFGLLAKPVVFMNDIAAVAANALSMVYGDFRAGYVIVDKKGLYVVRDPYTQKGFILFYTEKRYGGDVINWEAIKIQKISA
jgi:HK97 family phage major capsid protein